MSPLLPPLRITICTTVRKMLYILLAVDLLIYIKNLFPHLAEEKQFIYLQIHNHHLPDWIQYSFIAM